MLEKYFLVVAQEQRIKGIFDLRFYRGKQSFVLNAGMINVKTVALAIIEQEFDLVPYSPAPSLQEVLLDGEIKTIFVIFLNNNGEVYNYRHFIDVD